MREFKLMNSKGVEYSLTNLMHWMNDPTGLGFQRTISFVREGYEYLETESFLSQKSVGGQIIFRNYSEFQSFVSFLYDSPIYLYYKPINVWYRAMCEVTSLDKTELNENALLLCSVQFTFISTWAELVKTIKNDTPVIVTGGKTYPYTYDYQYKSGGDNTVIIQNGRLESPIRIIIRGGVTDPVWTLRQNGEVVASGKITASIPAGHQLVVNAVPSAMCIEEQTTDGAYIRNLYSYSDFSTARFIYAPAGESTLTVTDTGGGLIFFVVEIERLAYAV